MNRPRGVSVVAVAIVTAAVLLGWPAAGSAAPVSRPLSGSEVGAEQALVARLAPLLGRYGLELSSLEAQTAGTDAASPIAPSAAAIVFGGYRTSDPKGSTPAPVAALEAAIRKLAGPAQRALSDLDTDIKDKMFTNVGGIISAGRQITGLLNPMTVPMQTLKRDVTAIIRQLASELPPVSLAVGPGQPTGSCPRSEDPIDCWILQDGNGPTLSNWLGDANVVASIVGLIAGVGEIPTLGFDTPVTIAADVVGTGTSVAQFYVDLVRRAGYGGSTVDKVVTAFTDVASVGTSIFDLGVLGDALRLKAVSKAIEDAAPVVERVVDALHGVIPAGEQLQNGVKLLDDIAKLRDAKTLLEAKTQAETIINVLLSTVTAYNGPASSWLHQLATYLSKYVRAALGSPAPVVATPPACTRGSALSAAQRSTLPGQLRRADHISFSGEHFGTSKVICHGITSNTAHDMVALFGCCTISAPTPLAVFDVQGGHWKLLYSMVTRLVYGISLQGRDVIERTPVYTPRDFTCCPSHYRLYRLRWAGNRFVTDKQRLIPGRRPGA